MKLELIFMGAPASGKGTQTKLLSKEFNLPHIDTGSMLREAIASGSKEGSIAKTFIDKGNLVPVEIVSAIIKNRLLQKDCQNGFILDGFPRSMEQAEKLNLILKEINRDKGAKLMVLNIDVPFDI
ncbi:MAG: nucleoside monophosphate kinase, partial [Candidatus Gastranaerophilales bacterium]|nr:nucleoside monophosphate kinase [Candidatus Gastranaerophilales bacterium]